MFVNIKLIRSDMSKSYSVVLDGVSIGMCLVE